MVGLDLDMTTMDEEERTMEGTMQTKGFILAIQRTLAIGATMTTLEIMLTRASPLAVGTVVFLEAKVFLQTIQ